MPEQDHAATTGPPAWLLTLGAVALVAMGASMLFALAIGLANLSRIGV